jgi:hypothetical protein
MPGNANAPLGSGGVNQMLAGSGLLAPPTLPTAADSAQHRNLSGYVVLLITKYGMPRRKIYLDLGHARTAVARAHSKGNQAELVLCRLEPVTAGLDVDGEVTE